MRGKTGRPATRRNIKALVFRLARENPVWATAGSTEELADLGVRVPATMWEILKKARIEHATRRIRILGFTQHPAGAQTAQQARNLLIDLGEQAHRVKFMIRDRGPDFSAASGAVLAGAGIRIVLCTVRTPRMNAIAERWIGGRRRELLDRTLIWNENHLRRILREYETHHNQHRPHRSLDA